LKKTNITEVKITCIYNRTGADIVQILKESVLLFIAGEVNKVCPPIPSR